VGYVRGKMYEKGGKHEMTCKEEGKVGVAYYVVKGGGWVCLEDEIGELW